MTDTKTDVDRAVKATEAFCFAAIHAGAAEARKFEKNVDGLVDEVR